MTMKTNIETVPILLAYLTTTSFPTTTLVTNSLVYSQADLLNYRNLNVFQQFLNFPSVGFT